jgi:hypothetical protein
MLLLIADVLYLDGENIFGGSEPDLDFALLHAQSSLDSEADLATSDVGIDQSINITEKNGKCFLPIRSSVR